MPRYKESPSGFDCPYKHHCPYMEGLSTHWIFTDRTIEIDPPCICPHCQGQTDLSTTDTTSFVQEDIVLRPQPVATLYVHGAAYCPTCRRQVIRELDNELPFAPIGPNAKAAALYLRHEIKLPYRKTQHLMSALFGLDFVPASALGFEQRARKNADPNPSDCKPTRNLDMRHTKAHQNPVW